jgi:hypothetical protein
VRGPSDFLSREDVGLACEQFKAMAGRDDYWAYRDCRPLVLFWCSDLRIRHYYLKWSKRHFWTIETPRGKRVITASSPHAAWRFAAAVILYHIKKVQKERDNAVEQ